MNEFSTTGNSQGLLKNAYVDGDTPLTMALKKKRKRLKESKIPSEMSDDNTLTEGIEDET